MMGRNDFKHGGSPQHVTDFRAVFGGELYLNQDTGIVVPKLTLKFSGHLEVMSFFH